MTKAGICVFCVSATCCGILTAAAGAAGADRIPASSCMSETTAGSSNVRAFGGAAYIYSGSGEYLNCGLSNVSFYNATSVNVYVYQNGYYGPTAKVCVRSLASSTSYCDDPEETLDDTGYNTLSLEHTYWDVAYASYHPYVRVWINTSDQLIGINVGGI